MDCLLPPRVSPPSQLGYGNAPYVPPTTFYARQPHDTSASLLQFSTPTLIKYHLALSNAGRKQNKTKHPPATITSLQWLYSPIFIKKKNLLSRKDSDMGGKGGKKEKRKTWTLWTKKLSHIFCRTTLCHLNCAQTLHPQNSQYQFSMKTLTWTSKSSNQRRSPPSPGEYPSPSQN